MVKHIYLLIFLLVLNCKCQIIDETSKELLDQIIAHRFEEPFTDKTYGTGYMCENFKDIKEYNISAIQNNDNILSLAPVGGPNDKQRVVIDFSWPNNNSLTTDEDVAEYYRYVFCDRYFVEWCRSELNPNYGSLEIAERFNTSNARTKACVQSLRLEY